MKTKYSLLIAFISVVLALSVISCNNDATYDKTNNSVEYVELHIGQVGLASQGARYIDKVDFTQAYEDATFVLSGTLKDSDTKFEDSYQGLAKLNDVSIKIQAGTWTFTLVAYNTVDGKLADSILSATKTFEITSDTKELSFSLEFCEGQTLTGNLDYTITVPYVETASMTVSLVMDGTKYDPKYGTFDSGYSETLFAVDPTTYEQYSESATFESLPLVLKDGFYQTTFTFDNLRVGTYQLFIVYTTDFMDDTLSQETMASEQNIAVYPLITRTGSKNIEKVSKRYKIWYEDSVLEDDDITGNENLPNICANYQTIYLPALKKEHWTFDGWHYFDSDNKSVSLASSVDKEGNTVYILQGSVLSEGFALYPDWTEISLGNFAVTFNSMEGSSIVSQNVEENSCATKPEDPSRTGYTFGGWYTNKDYDSEAYDFATPVTADITLYAKWKVETYTITYSGIDEDTTNPNADITTYTIESDTISLADASKTGYTFCGWFDWGGNKVTSIDKGSTGNRAFEAQWTIEEYEVTFVTNCYNGTSDKPINYSFVVSYNEKASEYVQRISPLTREGYTLEGWYIDSTFKNKYDFDTPVTAALTLYANWTINTYTITYSSDYGEALAVKTVEWGTKLSEDDIAEIEAEGWVFKGWKIGETNTYATTETTVTDNLTLIADWSIAKITISYETVHGTAPVAQIVDYGTTLTEYLAEIEAAGYDFDGWLVAGKAAVAETTLTADITLTASWTAKTYSITYYGVENAANPNDVDEYTIESDPITLADASKDGYTFKGWFTTETFDEGTVATVIAKGSTGDKEFWAKWEINSYTVSFETNWSEWTKAAEQIEYKSTITEPTTERSGYELKWYSDPYFQNEYNFDTPVTDAITLYAEWTAIEYTITYKDVDGATNPNAEVTTYTVESNVINLADAEKKGYTFDGWYNSETATSPIKMIQKGSVENMELYARWTVIEYEITYVLDDDDAHPAQNASANPEKYTIEDATITLAAPERPGYTFKGWTTVNEEDETVSITEIDTSKVADVTVTATWEQTFTISITFEPIPVTEASGTWTLTEDTRTVHDEIRDEDTTYTVFVAPEDCDSYTWYVDGVQVEVDSETPNEYRPSGSGGTHSVNCLIIRTVTGDDGKEKEETIYLTGSFTLTVRYLPMG